MDEEKRKREGEKRGKKRNKLVEKLRHGTKNVVIWRGARMIIRTRRKEETEMIIMSKRKGKKGGKGKSNGTLFL